LDSMMVPEDYLQKGNILLNNVNWRYQNISMGKFCKVDSELSMVMEGRISMNNARQGIPQKHYCIISLEILFLIVVISLCNISLSEHSIFCCAR
jgi:hypothetical protein